MDYVKLGSSNIDISRICLGSMTWGNQNNQQDADQQIDYAIAQGINFIDTAEMYPIPPSPSNCNQTEIIIGDWLSRHQEQRDQLVIATKVAGPGLPWIRESSPISGKSVEIAVEASLKRLQTDYIDLYQLHWPNRSHPHFSMHWPNQIKFSETNGQQETEVMLEILEALGKCVDAGKIRACGLSDDTPWGINTYLKLAQEHNLPRMVSIQNEMNLLHTKDWPYVIENCVQEDIAYLAWSPLAAGALTGKYLNGARPEGSRWTLMQRNGLFRDTELSNKAIAEYAEIAHANNITPAQLALAWLNQVDGVSSSIIGATNLEQLKENIDAFSIKLDSETLNTVSSVHRRYPSPY